MKLNLGQNGKIYFYSSEFVPNTYWHTKLAFSVNLKQNAEVREYWDIIYDSNEIRVDIQKHELSLPVGITEEQYCYVLRAFSDTLQLLAGNIPLHAAAVSYKGENSVLIFANSKAGKSYIADMLCQRCKDFDIIGDDHIVLVSDTIYGNYLRRIRDANGNDTKVVPNCGLAYGKCSVAYCYIPSPVLTAEFIDKTKWIQQMQAHSAFKYACNTFVIKNKNYCIDNLFQCNTMELYHNLILSYAFDELCVCSGTHGDVVDLINKKMFK